MELCSDDEDSRRSNSTNIRPSDGRVNNPLLPPHLDNWYIAVRKSNGGSCIFPSWEDYIANVSSLFDASRRMNSDISGTTEDVTELAAFPTIQQAIDYLNQNTTTTTNHSSVLSSPSSSIDSIDSTAKTIITTNSSRGCGRSVRNTNRSIHYSQSRPQHQQSHRNDNSNINSNNNDNNNSNSNTIPDAVTSILNASFPNQNVCAGVGTSNEPHHQSRHQSQSQSQSQSYNKNITTTAVNKIIDDDGHKDTGTGTAKIADIASEGAGKTNKRHSFSGTSDHDTGTGGKRTRRETSLKKTTGDTHNASSLDALAEAAEHKFCY